MKIATQTSAEFTYVGKLIEDIPIATLTTLEDDGALASRPMTALEMDAQGALWFFTDVQSSKVDHLRAVNLSFVDRDHGAYVSLLGHGEIDTDSERIQSLWTVFAKPWFPDGPDSSKLALLKFIPDTADYWDGPSSKMVRAFGMIASFIAGKPVALGAWAAESRPALGLAGGAGKAQRAGLRDPRALAGVAWLARAASRGRTTAPTPAPLAPSARGDFLPPTLLGKHGSHTALSASTQAAAPAPRP